MEFKKACAGYAVIEFDKQRNELGLYLYSNYSKAIKHDRGAKSYGIQIQKRHDAGYWFPIDTLFS